METLVPRDMLDVDNDLLPDVPVGTPLQPLPLASRHTRTNSDAIATAAACSLELSTIAAAYPPQQLATTCSSLPTSSFAHTAPTMGDGGQRAPGQPATPGQPASPQQTSRWMITLTAIGRSLSGNTSLWLDLAILSIEQLLNALHTIRNACHVPTIVGSDASAAATETLEGET
jgi:hypothetical protein